MRAIIVIVVALLATRSYADATIDVVAALREGCCTSQKLNTQSVQLMEAARWAALAAGVELRPHDYCEMENASRHIVASIANHSDSIGVLWLGDCPHHRSDLVAVLTSAMPNLALVSPSGSTATPTSQMFLTAPSIATMAAAAGSVLRILDANTRVGLIVGGSHQETEARSALHRQGVELCAPAFTTDQLPVHELMNCNSVAFILDGIEVRELLSSYKVPSLLPKKRVWLLATEAVSARDAVRWRKEIGQPGRYYVLQAKLPHLESFRRYFLSNLLSAANSSQHPLAPLLAEVTNCNDNSSGLHRCESMLTMLEIEELFPEDPRVSLVATGISSLAAAWRSVQLQQKGESSGTEKQKAVLRELRRLALVDPNVSPAHGSKFSSQRDSSEDNSLMELEGVSARVASDGEMLFRKFDIWEVTLSGNITQVGWYSNDEGVSLALSAKSGQSALLTDIATVPLAAGCAAAAIVVTVIAILAPRMRRQKEKSLEASESTTDKSTPSPTVYTLSYGNVTP